MNDNDNARIRQDVLERPLWRFALEDDIPSELPAYSEDGVDLTLIRYTLSLTPLDRLRAAQRNANTVMKLREVCRRLRP